LAKAQEKYVRKILSFFVRFTGISFLAGLVALGVYLAYCAGQKVAIWAPPASRNMAALTRRLIAAYARSRAEQKYQP
jgi:hypothetical protein